MNIAIIGCGYVGTAVARYWREHSNFSVTATTTTAERVPSLAAIAQRVEVLKGNDLNAMQSLLQNQDVVLLCVGAANANVYETTYLETAKTLVSALKAVPQIQQVIYTASYAIYGDRNGEWVDENSAVAPANSNGEILVETEQVLLSAATEKTKICILRLGGIYGPNRELVKIFSRLSGTTQPGDGSEASNWIHLDDIVGAIEFARANQLTGIYNLVNGNPVKQGELLAQLCDRYNLAPVSWDVNLPKIRPYNARVSNQKLREAGYELIHPEVTL